MVVSRPFSDAERLADNVKRANLFVVRQARVHASSAACTRPSSRPFAEPLLPPWSRAPPENSAGSPAAPLAAPRASCAASSCSSGSGATLCPEFKMSRFLMPPGDPPIALRVDFSLIARMKPSALERLRRFRRPLPVSRKHIRPAHENFAILRDRHFDSRHRRPHAPRLDVRWIIHRANRRRLRQPVNLQHRNPEHHEEKLRLDGQRRRSANQRLQVRPDVLPDRGKHEPRSRAASTRNPPAKRSLRYAAAGRLAGRARK